ERTQEWPRDVGQRELEVCVLEGGVVAGLEDVPSEGVAALLGALPLVGLLEVQPRDLLRRHDPSRRVTRPRRRDRVVVRSLEAVHENDAGRSRSESAHFRTIQLRTLAP